MRNRVLIAGAAFLSLVVIAYAIFVSLGGNNPIVIQKIEFTPPSLAGITYEGTPQDERLGKSFDRIETILSINPGKKLHTIYEVEPAGKLDTMRVFIGFDQSFKIDSLEFKQFKESSFLIASIEANRWVMPGPNRVKEEIEAFANEKNLVLSGVFIDKILSDSKVQVIAPLRD